MKIIVYLSICLLFILNSYSQTYDVLLNNDGITLSIFKENSGKFSLNDRFNPIDSTFNFKFAIDNSNPKIEISNQSLKYSFYTGIIRSVEYINLSIPINDLKMVVYDAIIKIHYAKKIIQEKNSKINDEQFFSDFDNQPHIAYLRKSKNDNVLLNSDWFNPNSEYVKFFTTTDAPAKVLLKDVLEIKPEWQNKLSNNLSLYQRGNEIPIYILDNNGRIDGDDTLFFMGSRAYGDTTYFENYTNKEYFFLEFNESKIGKRFLLKESKYISGELSDNVYIEKHIERDMKYSTGSLFISNQFVNQIEKSNHFDTRTVMGEGWFWDILTPQINGLPNDTSKGSYVINYQNLNPIFDDEENMNFKMFYRSLQDSINDGDFLPQRITHYDLSFDINGKINKQKQFSGFKIDSLEINSQSNILYSGHNPLKVIHKQMYSTTNSSILVDYFKLSGNVKAIAEKGKLDFITDINYNKNLRVSNFKSGKLVLINKNEETISFSNFDKNGFNIRASADLLNNNFVTMAINDSVISSYGSGLHIFINKAPEYKEFKYLNSKSSNDETVEYLNNLPKNSLILITNAGNTNNSSNLIEALSKLGIKRDLNKINGNWIFASIIGSSINEEFFNETEMIRLSKMYDFEDGNSFSYLLNINTTNRSEIHAVDFESSETSKPILVNKIDLKGLEDEITAIYITHKNFYPAIERLRDFREKSQGIKVRLIDVENIYNQFNFGNESPHAIKNYLKYYYKSNKDLPKYLTVVGDATWDPRNLSINSISTNYMPVYGNPVSDFWYGLLDGEDDFDPEIYVGRISVKSNNEANDVVNKLIQYDTTSPSDWMRRYLFLTGGFDTGQRNSFFGYIGNYYQQYIKNDIYCNNIDYVRKNENSPSSSSQGTEIREKINKGNAWTIYIGHAASEIFELDGWSAYSLNNNQKYGLLSTISCNTGAFAEPNLITCRNEEYLLVADKGFIGIMGSTTLGFVGEHNFITSKMIELIGDSSRKERNLGEIFYFGKTKMAKNSYQLFTLYNYSLIGDPLTRFRFGKKPDPYINLEDVNITVDGLNKQATDKDSLVNIKGKILNYGYNTNQYFEVKMVRNYNNKNDSSSIFINELCSPKDYEFQIDVRDKPGIHNIIITLDSDNILDEDNDNNNSITLRIEVFKDGLIFLDPQANWDVSKNDTKIRVLNPLDSTHLFDYYFEVLSNDGDLIMSSNTINQSDEFDINEDYIDWKPDLEEFIPNNYLIKARSISKIDGKQSELTIIPINLKDDINPNKINYEIHTNTDLNFEEISNLDYIAEDKALKLKKYSLPFKTLSVTGIRDSNMVFKVRPFVNLEVGNKVFVQGYHDRGFNVGVFSSTPNGISTKYRLFDTWGKDASHPEGNWYKDSVAVDLVRFLRDSISENDYLFIGTSSSVFRLPVYFKIFAKEPNEGSIDTLLDVFKQYGSYIADTLVLDTNNQGFDISFTMVGYKGAKVGSIYEAINMVGDSARTQGEIFIFDTEGKFVSNPIGESKKWNKVYLNGKFDDSNQKLLVKIFGIKPNNEKFLLKETEYIEPIDISEVSANLYPNIQVECQFMMIDSTLKSMINSQSIGISSIIVDFIPLDELSIVKSLTNLEKNNILRGEPVELDIAMRNLSLRGSIDSVTANIEINNGSGNPYQYSTKFENVEPNSLKINKLLIETDYLQANNPIFINLNKEDKPKEQYFFNNNKNLLLGVRKDSIKPEVKLIIDGKPHIKDDYISQLPEFRVELYDNSPLKIIDSNSITVRVNGYLHPYQRTLSSKFERINDGSNLKAVFTFRPDTIQYEDISIIVYYYDAELNRDTLFTSAKASLNNSEIYEYITYPNPAIDEINFKIKYKAPDSEATAIIDIYDMSGNKVNSLKQNISIGDNNINFFAKDSQGNSLSSHLYFYKISINSKYYVEPKYGKFIIVK